jgi:hypothetical protein
MTLTLSTFCARYLRDRASLERQLEGPVVVFEPAARPLGAETTEERYRLQTASGLSPVVLGTGETIVFEVRKLKDNAFQRGVTVGRTSNNDLVIDDHSVSRFHAWFQRGDDGAWQLADAGSKNGTYLDGHRLAPKRPSPLSGEVRLKFGQIEARFLMPRDFLALIDARLGPSH